MKSVANNKSKWVSCYLNYQLFVLYFLVHVMSNFKCNNCVRACVCVCRVYCRTTSNRSMLLFGHGDGGGGPAVSHLEKLSRMVSAPGLPRIHQRATPEEFFEQVLIALSSFTILICCSDILTLTAERA